MAASEATIRWQAYARESRTAVNSHFLAYSGAIVALQGNVLVDADVDKILSPGYFLSAGLFATSSIILGSIIVVVRLNDARLTARVARMKDEKEPTNIINTVRKKADLYGEWANRLIPWQVATFVVSAILFVAWLVIAHICKLT